LDEDDLELLTVSTTAIARPSLSCDRLLQSQ
jgi:hypothetical protein